MAGGAGRVPIRVRFVSCRNDAGARPAARLLLHLGVGRAVVDDGVASALDYAVMLCPPGCDT